MIDTQPTTSPIPTIARTEPSHIHIPRPSRLRRIELGLDAADGRPATYVGRRTSCAPRPSSPRP